MNDTPVDGAPMLPASDPLLELMEQTRVETSRMSSILAKGPALDPMSWRRLRASAHEIAARAAALDHPVLHRAAQELAAIAAAAMAADGNDRGAGPVRLAEVAVGIIELEVEALKKVSGRVNRNV